MKKLIIIAIVGFIVGSAILFLRIEKRTPIGSFAKEIEDSDKIPSNPTSTLITPIPTAKTLANDYYIFQTFNNCGPAALSMVLSYYGINVSQEELGRDIRPNQHPKGISDDKSVTLDELAIKAKEYGFVTYHRPNGTSEIIKQFIAHDIPVVARTWLKNGEDIGHYRVVKGYDEGTQSFLQDDSLQGKNLWYTYGDFNELWEAFNYEYLVLVPAEKTVIAEQILGKDVDEKKSWEKAAEVSIEKYKENSSNVYAGFNAAIAYSRIGEHEQAIKWFEEVENKLSRRMLWYQLDPILSYLAMRDYSRVMQLTNSILGTENNAHAELYLIQARVYIKQNRTNEAKSIYQQAIRFNKNLHKYQTVLERPAIEELSQL